MASLPRSHREVLALHYLHEHSHADIATFLDVPTTTVNNRLAAARRMLKRQLTHPVHSEERLMLHTHVPAALPNRFGRIVEASGSRVRVRFLAGAMPDVPQTVRVDGDLTAGSAYVVHRDRDGVALCVPLASVEHWRRGMRVETVAGDEQSHRIMAPTKA